MKCHAEEAFLGAFVVEEDSVAQIEENLRPRCLRVVGKDVDDALLVGDEDAVASVAGVGQHDGPQQIGFALVGHAFPTRPLQIGKGDRGFQRHRRFVHLGAGNAAGDGRHAARLAVGDQDALAARFQANPGRRAEAFRQNDGFLAKPRNHQESAVFAVADVEPAVMVPRQAGDGAQTVGQFLRRAVRQFDSIQRTRSGVADEKMRSAVEQQGGRLTQRGKICAESRRTLTNPIGVTR